jgi:hypothetical protein
MAARLDGVEAASILSITPAAFRKRLSRAREAVVKFTRAHCGLVDPANACRCARRPGSANDRPQTTIRDGWPLSCRARPFRSHRNPSTGPPGWPLRNTARHSRTIPAERACRRRRARSAGWSASTSSNVSLTSNTIMRDMRRAPSRRWPARDTVATLSGNASAVSSERREGCGCSLLLIYVGTAG